MIVRPDNWTWFFEKCDHNYVGGICNLYEQQNRSWFFPTISKREFQFWFIAVTLSPELGSVCSPSPYGTSHILRKHIFRIFGPPSPYVSMVLVVKISKNWHFLTPQVFLRNIWMVSIKYQGESSMVLLSFSRGEQFEKFGFQLKLKNKAHIATKIGHSNQQDYLGDWFSFLH